MRDILTRGLFVSSGHGTVSLQDLLLFDSSWKNKESPATMVVYSGEWL